MARRQRYSKAGPLKGRGVDPYRVDQSAFYFTPAEARAEYARLRREANRRLEVLRRSDYKNMRNVRNQPITYEALPKDASESYVRMRLAKVARFLGQKTSSLKGMREMTQRTLDTLRSPEYGYTFLNKSNIRDFMQFMDEVNRHKAAKGLPSDDIVDMWRTARNKRIDTFSLARDFDFWLQHQSVIDKAPRSNSTITSEEFARKVRLKID